MSPRMINCYRLRKNVQTVFSSFRNLGTNGKQNEFLAFLLLWDKHTGVYSFAAANANKAIE
jgi:hypothetical protein